VAAQLVLADEADEAVTDFNIEAGVLYLGDGAGDDGALAKFGGARERIFAQLLDAEADALFLDINVENLGFDDIALVIGLDCLLTRRVPVDVGHVNHAVNVVVEADKETKFGDVLDRAFNGGANRRGLREAVPRIVHALLQTKADAATRLIDLENHHFHFLGGGNDLARVDVLLRPAHFGDVNETLNAGFQLHKGAVIGDVGDAAREFCADRVFGFKRFPWIFLKLLHAEADALGVLVEADDLNLDRFADAECFGRMVDAAPCNVGDMQQAVHTTEIDEGAVIGDILDDAFQRLAFFQRADQLGAGFGAAFFQNSAAGDNDVAAAAIHFQDLEGLRNSAQRADVADRADVNLAAGQEGNGAGKIDGKATLDAAKDDAIDAF